MTETFSEMLRRENEGAWAEGLDHAFLQRWREGRIADADIAWYLIQEQRYLDSLFVLLGAGIVTTDSPDVRLALAAFSGEMAGTENDYFRRFFEELGVTEQVRAQEGDLPATGRLKRVFAQAAGSGDYVAVLTVITAVMWFYLEGALLTPVSESTVYGEWVALHKYPSFRDFVALLRSELDRVGPQRPELAREYFSRVLRLEIEFFDQSLEMTS